MNRGDWVVYTYCDRGILRSLTGTVINANTDRVTFKSDGGQPDHARGETLTVPSSDVRLCNSAFAPHNQNK